MSPHRKALSACLLLAAAALAGDAAEVVCAVSYVAADGLYVDAGSASGLAPGDAGVVSRDGSDVARVEVVAVSRSSARLRVVARLDGRDPAPGDRVRVAASGRPPEPEPGPAPLPEELPEAPFVPLLERSKSRAAAAHRRNLFHGSAWLRQLVRADGAGDFRTTTLGSRGGVERLGGGPWALRWSGNASVRSGGAFEGGALEGARLDLYELDLLRSFAEGGFARVGRFAPVQLPGAGFLDGAQVEFERGASLRLGGMLGLRPERDDLSPSLHEPTAAVYATASSGRRDATYWSGTAGVMASLFDGELDRLALLLDQHFAVAGGLRVDASLEADADVGAALVREGSRLTRFDARAEAPIGDRFGVRAGIDHWERPDTAAERSAIGVADPLFFDRGYWRPWVGAWVEPGESWRFDAEVAFLDAPDADLEPRGRISATRRGILGLDAASASLTVFQLEGASGDGFGGLLAAWLPLRDGTWSLSPSVGFRWFEAEASADAMTLVDLRFQAEYHPPGRWSAFAAIAHLAGDGADATTFEFGLSYRW